MRWKSSEGRPIAELPNSPPNWHTSPFFGYVLAAKEWGLRPSALGLCQPEEDLAVMLTFVDTRARMQAYEQRQAEKKNRAK